VETHRKAGAEDCGKARGETGRQAGCEAGHEEARRRPLGNRSGRAAALGRLADAQPGEGRRQAEEGRKATEEAAVIGIADSADEADSADLNKSVQIR
jgi:hypothetical protein